VGYTATRTTSPSVTTQQGHFNSPPILRHSRNTWLQGFRLEWATRLRAAGIDFALPSPEQLTQGVPPEEIHLELDVSDQLETKMACIMCHRTQVAPDWPYHRVPRDVAAWVLGREYYIRAHPEVAPNEAVPEDFFDGIIPD
jgi:LmbE family N-acetylglucosaminyl deacetylase